MNKYQVIKKGGFKGSPNGAVTVNFIEGATVSHTELGDELAKVALKEKWIKVIKEIRPSPEETQTESVSDDNPAEK